MAAVFNRVFPSMTLPLTSMTFPLTSSMNAIASGLDKRAWITDRRSMAGTAPTDPQFITARDAGPVHCSVWLFRNVGQPPSAILRDLLHDESDPIVRPVW